jgi:hypothetical protein
MNPLLAGNVASPSVELMRQILTELCKSYHTFEVPPVPYGANRSSYESPSSFLNPPIVKNARQFLPPNPRSRPWKIRLTLFLPTAYPPSATRLQNPAFTLMTCFR